jgi:hypothetical protein
VQIHSIVSQLKKERRRIDRAIAVLTKLGGQRKAARNSPRKKTQVLSTEIAKGRARMKAKVLQFPTQHRNAS